MLTGKDNCGRACYPSDGNIFFFFLFFFFFPFFFFSFCFFFPFFFFRCLFSFFFIVSSLPPSSTANYVPTWPDDGGFDAADVDRDLIADRLKEDVAEEKGRLYRHIADDFAFDDPTSTLFRMDGGPTTAIATCDPYVYTVTRNRYLAKWRLPPHPPPAAAAANRTPSRKPKRVRYVRGGRAQDPESKGHSQAILCVAASGDGRFVATGGRDNRLIVWDAESLEILKVFSQHRAAVTGLAFRRGTNELYSSSSDRTVKLWSLNELAYIETLFGHQDEVVDIAALAGERCVTVGARDRTARLWKIVDETQLVFRGGGASDGKLRKNKDGSTRYDEGSMDVVAMIDEEHFVTGSDNGYPT